MAMLSHRLRRVLVALPSHFRQSYTPTRASNFLSVSSLSPRTVVKQSTGFALYPVRLFSKTQYQYDPYTGEDSFTPDTEGCDFNHWLITMDFPKENPPSREEMISIFEETCAKGLGLSLEEAKKKLYAICTTSYQGFQATMSIEEVEKFRDLPGVQYILPDSYVDVENKVYGGDKYENGVITPGPIPVPTKEGFESLDKESTSEQEQAQKAQTQPDQDLTSEQVLDQGNQTPPDQRNFKLNQGTPALIQGQDQGSGMPTPTQGKGRGQVPTSRQGLGQGNPMPSFRGLFNRDQRTRTLGQRQGQGNQTPSFQGSFKQGQGTPSVGQVQGQESKLPTFQRGYNHGPGTPINGQGQGQGQGSQIPSYQMGYSQGQGAQTPPCQGSPSSYGQGAVASYKQGPPQGNFSQGTQENYNQMGRGNNTQQSGGNYGSAQGGSLGFGHGGQLLSPYQGSYNQGEGTPMPGQGQGGQIPSHQMVYSQGHGAPVPPYQVNYNQGTPGNYGQWAFVNYNPGPPHGNFLHGPQQNYNQGRQWNFSPPNGGNYGPPQFGNQMPQYQMGYNQGQGAPFPVQWQCQGCGMLSYQGSYNQGQGTPNPGQWRGQGCAMPSSYQASYSHSQGASVPPHQGNYDHGIPRNYGQGTSANFNQGIPVNYNQMGQGNYNLQSGGSYVHTHGSGGFPGQGQNQTSPQEDQRNVAGGWSNNNYHTDPTETGKIAH